MFTKLFYFNILVMSRQLVDYIYICALEKSQYIVRISFRGYCIIQS
jgi:hypothetical protein